jgi:hypothetical protein
MDKNSKKYLMYAAVAVGGYLVYRHFSKSDALPGTGGTISYLPSLEAQAAKETSLGSGMGESYLPAGYSMLGSLPTGYSMLGSLPSGYSMLGTVAFLPSLEQAAAEETDLMYGTMKPNTAARYLGVQGALSRGNKLGDRSRDFLSSQGFKLRGSRPTPADVYRHNVSVAGAVMGMLGSDCHTCDSPYNIAN